MEETDQTRAEQNRAEQNRTEQNKLKCILSIKGKCCFMNLKYFVCCVELKVKMHVSLENEVKKKFERH